MEPIQTRVRKSTDAITKNPKAYEIFLTVGKLFWAENKPIKARKFLERAVELDKGQADSWICLQAFEKAQGNIEKVKEIEAKFSLGEARHGELWQSESKKIENWHKSHLEILAGINFETPKLFK